MEKPLSMFGQLNFTEILAGLNSGQIKAQKIQTQKGEQIVFDVNLWVHQEADQFNNNASVQMCLKKEVALAGVKNPFYIGNLRYKQPTVTEATQEDINKIVNDNVENIPV